MLDARQAEEFWKLFGDSALFVKWPEFRAELFYRLDVVSLRAGATVFEPGGAPVYLYLVGSGVIQQTLRHDNPVKGPVWLQVEHKAGQFFGQHALFGEHYRSLAMVTEDATLYLLTAADLRVAMERNTGLHDVLLRETLAGRLRRVPLLRSLEDEEVYWLAQVIEERHFSENEPLPLADEPGLWIIDWGHVEVTGPANPYKSPYSQSPNRAAQAIATERNSSWRLTAGHFFLARDTPDDIPGLARTAKARLETHAFYLSDKPEHKHVRRLLSVFEDVRRITSRLLDIATHLKQIAEIERRREEEAAEKGSAALETARRRRLFSGPDMREEHYGHLAQFCGWEFVPSGQNITTQGSVGHSFVIILEGMAIIHALDDQGRPRPRNALRPNDFYGETSLLEGKPRDATVRAVRAPEQAGWSGPGGAEVIILDRRDLQYAFAERQRLWNTNQDIPLFRKSVWRTEEKHLYDWMDEGETVIWHDRAHWFWLLIPELAAIAAFTVFLLALLLIFEGLQTLIPSIGTLRPALLIAALILSGLILAPGVILIAVNYFLDYYVVTNRRVTRRDRQWLTQDIRTEAPVEMVQNVLSEMDFWGWIFNYGKLTIHTAAKAGAVIFDHVPHPETVKKHVLEGSATAVAAHRGQEKEALRREVISGLRLVLPIPERTQPLGEGVVPPPGRQQWWLRFRRWVAKRRTARPERLPGARRGEGWVSRLPIRFPWGRSKVMGRPLPGLTPEPGQIIWRKHWVNLVQRAGLPALSVLLLVALLIVAIATGIPRNGFLGFNSSALLLAWFVPFAVAVAVLWYQAKDYHNDIYVVTDDKLIDIEAKPLSIHFERREGSLDRVQTVFTEQRGIWANILNYGNVIVLTAAADPGFTIDMVGAPRQVQAIIFQKVDAFRRRQEEQRAKGRRQELIESLDVYHRLREEREKPYR